MKRDMDLIRKLLFKLEGIEQTHAAAEELRLDGYSESQLDYHIALLLDSGLVVSDEVSAIRSVIVNYRSALLRLGWAGHEFLDMARDEGRWQQAKQKIGANVGSASFEILKAVLAGLVTKAMGLT